MHVCCVGSYQKVYQLYQVLCDVVTDMRAQLAYHTLTADHFVFCLLRSLIAKPILLINKQGSPVKRDD